VQTDPRSYLQLRDVVTDDRFVGTPLAHQWVVRATARHRGRWEVGLWNDRIGWRIADVERLALVRRAVPSTPPPSSNTGGTQP
jgi:hypothetical protein